MTIRLSTIKNYYCYLKVSKKKIALFEHERNIDNNDNAWIKQIRLNIANKKAQLTQGGTRDSEACLKARCEQNLSSPMPATFCLHMPEGATGLAQPFWLKMTIFSYPPLV